MKKIVLFSLMMACLPFMALAQSGNDDLYYIPKKKEKKVEAKTVVKKEQTSVMGNGTQVTAPIVVRDVNGNTRDLDEYNRRYSSRENEFSYENDTLYIQEKPYLEQGEWVNGFVGSQEDYDYAMRIIRFRSPSFAVSISSPFYWDIISLGYSSNWNVFDTGMYAFAFPTFSNNWWWDWRYNRMTSFRYYPSSWWYGSSWYYSSNWWYGWGYHHPPHIHHSHWHQFPPHYAHGGVGGYWGNNHGWNGSSAHNPGIHAGRYADNSRGSMSGRTQVNRGDRVNRNENVSNRRPSRNEQTVNRGNASSVRNSAGRVVTSRNSASSVRPQRSASRGGRSGQTVSSETGTSRSTGVYTRQTQGKASSYSRSSSTRSTVNNSGTWAGSGRSGSYSSSSSSSGGSRSSSVSSSSSRSSSSGSYSSGGGGGRSASAGGTSRGSGGRR